MPEIFYNPAENPPQNDGKIYLVVADETEEFNAALRYAARKAKSAGARVAILYVLNDDQGFLFWGRIEDRAKAERRAEAENFLNGVAARLKDMGGDAPMLFLQDGDDRAESIIAVIAACGNIAALVLGGDTRSRTPGPLVQYFSGKGMAQLQVPLIIVPGHITPEGIEKVC
jgi:nucleotide-binding universal stress UspA family protein